MDIFEAITSKINEQIENVNDAITAGRPTTFDEYKRLCGEVRGLLLAKDIVKDLKNKMENSDD